MGWAALAAVVLLCGGCAATSEALKKVSGGESTSSAAPRNATHNAAHAALNEGIALYDKGEFNRAIKHLSGAPEIWSADKSVQTTALKYMAFSYCVTSRPTPCRQQFEKALKLDPAFDLAPGEKGHPAWGPVFDRVKKTK